MAKKQNSKAGRKSSGQSSTSVERKSGGKVARSSSRNESVWVEDLPEHCAVLTVGGKITKNMGEFESISVNVSLSMPCDPQSVDQCYESTSEWVDRRLLEELDKAVGG